MMLSKRHDHDPASNGNVVVWRVLPAFAIKVPLFPLHTWLPDAHTEAPTAGSVMLAGRAAEDGHLRHAALLPAAVPDASRSFALRSPSWPSSE